MSTVRVAISLVSLIMVLVVVQSVVLRQVQQSADTPGTVQKREVRQEVQSLQTTPTPTSGAAGPTITPSAQIKSRLSPTPFPSTTTPAATVILQNFIYANSTVIEQDDTHVTLQTTDDVHTVFQWYEKKMEELHVRGKATVKTEVNNDFLAKLRATIAEGVISIQIQKKSNERIVFVEASISPS